MPKPKSKEELLQQAKSSYEKLFELISKLSENSLHADFKGDSMNRNVRDVLMHLHSWHVMYLEWHKVGMKNKKPDMPAKEYTWQTLPALNQKIWAETQNKSLEEAKKLLEGSYKKILKIIEGLSDEQLFTKKMYAWTGSTSVGAYLILNTCSHYNWAYKLINKSVQ